VHLYADLQVTAINEQSLATARREALRQIIGTNAVGRQADLVRMLRRAGHRVTQSSISRDLRELGAAKLCDHYVLPEATTPAHESFDAVAGFVREVRTAGPSLTVVRTSAGAAQSVALALDDAHWPEIVGTISGDDTIFVATETEVAQARLLGRLHDTFRV
jgi:transcriptional regulator of arginine metabolism